MLEKEPRKRATYEEMMSHPFFHGVYVAHFPGLTILLSTALLYHRDWQAIRDGAARPPNHHNPNKKSCYVPQDEQSNFHRGDVYLAYFDPYPMFSWMSPSLSVQRGSTVVVKMAGSVVRQVHDWIEAVKNHAKLFSFMLRGAADTARTEKFTPAFIFPNCPSALSTADHLPYTSSTPFTHGSESGESLAESMLSIFMTP